LTAQAHSQVTQALADLRRGDAEAAERLWPLVYDELRRLARSQMARERRGHTLQPTALVHEAYLRLMGSGDGDAGTDTRWANRAHFFVAAATAMRHILIERARARARLKRGGDRERVTLSDAAAADGEPSVDLLALNEALQKLDAIDSRKCAIVTLRHLVGCSLEETAEALGLSPALVRKDWTFAKAWLHRELSR